MYVNATLMDFKITEVNSKTQAECEQQCELSTFSTSFDLTVHVNDKFKMSRGNAVDL